MRGTEAGRPQPARGEGRRVTKPALVAVLIMIVAAFASISAATGVATPTPTAPASGSGDDSARGRIDSFVARRWPHGASGTILVARDGKAIACLGRGWADRARRVRAGCDTAYDLMSMTKQFTAAAVLKLQMIGKLRVTDPIGRYLSPVPPDKRAITIKELLDQSSGLVDSLGDDYEPLSRGRMLAEAMRSKLLSPPGRAYHYSNVNYSILAAIIEAASGTGYERFLHRYLFRPAGMRHTGYVLPRWAPDQVAVEYDRRGRPTGRPFEHPWAKGGPYWNLRGNGGIISTAPDILRWDRALRGDVVLDARARSELFAPRVREVRGEFYAYGWNDRATPLGPLVEHNGGNEWSFGVLARSLPQRITVFWISNHAHQFGRWDLERDEREVTMGLYRAALGGSFAAARLLVGQVRPAASSSKASTGQP